MLEGEAEVAVGEGDVPLVVGKDQGTFDEQHGGILPLLYYFINYCVEGKEW